MGLLTERDLNDFMDGTTDDDIDEFMWRLTHDHNNDNGDNDEDTNDGDTDDLQHDRVDAKTVRLRRLLRTRSAEERIILQQEWEAEEDFRKSEHHIAHRTT